MNNIIYDLFAACLQDGYIGNLVDIVNNAKGPKRLYEMSEHDFTEGLGLSKRMAKHIINRRNEYDGEGLIRIMEQENIGFVRYFDNAYPKRLGQIASMPYGLFYRGALPDDDTPSVALIGARECSQYGRLMAEYFGDRLAREGVNIISGMAYGIDGIAQMAAIDAGGKSYAVLGSGVMNVYPPSNKPLYDRLTDGCGGVMSEYNPLSCASGRQFPPRNRIISALADVVIVVEAKAKSGTLITVDMAIDQGKDVMVIPGRITDPLSVGCLNLMKIGAVPAICIDDVLQMLDKSSKKKKLGNVKTTEKKERIKLSETFEKVDTKINAEKNNQKIHLERDEELVYSVLDLYPQNPDDIAQKTNLSLPVILKNLTSLELKGRIKEVTCNYFIRLS